MLEYIPSKNAQKNKTKWTSNVKKTMREKTENPIILMIIWTLMELNYVTKNRDMHTD